MARSLKSQAQFRAPAPPSGPAGALPEAPLGGTRSEAVRRLQMGAVGVVAVLLLIGLASIIKDRASETAATAVAGAAATSSPSPSAGAADPLAEAGVIPEMPSGPSPEATATDTAAPGIEPGAR